MDWPEPENGVVNVGVYRNSYFGIAVPLPPTWSEDLAGPPPSPAGSYVLSALISPKVDRTTMLIVAQDLFFGAKPYAGAAAFAADFRDSIRRMPYMTIDRDLSGTMIGGQSFLRLDYHAGELYRVWLAIERRCHLLMFNITGPDGAAVDRIAGGLAAMTLPAAISERAENAPAVPVCLEDYVTDQTLLRKVDPVPQDPRFVTVPVRIIIGADGRVRHVHVISASPAQRRAIEEALVQWEFKPYKVAGRPTEVETGVRFKFKASGP